MSTADPQDLGASTRIITNREVVHEGVTFHWWAVGDGPALVTINNSVFGSLQQFTHGDRKAFALSLAKKLLDQHSAPAELECKTEKQADHSSTALNKAGWFQDPQG